MMNLWISSHWNTSDEDKNNNNEKRQQEENDDENRDLEQGSSDLTMSAQDYFVENKRNIRLRHHESLTRETFLRYEDILERENINEPLVFWHPGEHRIHSDGERLAIQKRRFASRLFFTSPTIEDLGASTMLQPPNEEQNNDAWLQQEDDVPKVAAVEQSVWLRTRHTDNAEIHPHHGHLFQMVRDYLAAFLVGDPTTCQYYLAEILSWYAHAHDAGSALASVNCVWASAFSEQGEHCDFDQHFLFQEGDMPTTETTYSSRTMDPLEEQPKTPPPTSKDEVRKTLVSLMEIVFTKLVIRSFLMQRPNIFRLVHCATAYFDCATASTGEPINKSNGMWLIWYAVLAFLFQVGLLAYISTEVSVKTVQGIDVLLDSLDWRMLPLGIVSMCYYGLVAYPGVVHAVLVYRFYGAQYSLLQIMDLVVNVVLPVFLIVAGLMVVLVSQTFLDAVLNAAALYFIQEIDDNLPNHLPNDLIGDWRTVFDNYLTHQAISELNELFEEQRQKQQQQQQQPKRLRSRQRSSSINGKSLAYKNINHRRSRIVKNEAKKKRKKEQQEKNKSNSKGGKDPSLSHLDLHFQDDMIQSLPRELDDRDRKDDESVDEKNDKGPTEVMKKMMKKMRFYDSSCPPPPHLDLQFEDMHLTPIPRQQSRTCRPYEVKVNGSSMVPQIVASRSITSDCLFSKMEWCYKARSPTQIEYLRLWKLENNNQMIELPLGNKSSERSTSSSLPKMTTHTLTGVYIITSLQLSSTSIKHLRVCGSQSCHDFQDAVEYYSLFEMDRTTKQLLWRHHQHQQQSKRQK